MSEHTPLTEGYCPTCQVDGRQGCMTSTGRDHPSRRHFALGWHAALAARTSTATADTGLRERVQRAIDDELDNLRDDGARPSHSVVRRIQAILATAAPTTDTGARDE